MQTLTLAAVQMDCVLGDKEQNLQKAEEYVRQVGEKVDLICFPEFFSTGYSLKQIGDDFFTLAEVIPGPTTERFAVLAREYHTAIVGNIVEKDERLTGVLYDTTFAINEFGEYVGKYRKSHLYPTENAYFRAGSEFPVFELCGVRVGTATCYDHAFGEMFRMLALSGAEVIVIPSVVPKNFEYLLDLRTRARAQDNQIFAVAVNRVGIEDGVVYCGCSKVVNPRGEVVAEIGDEEGVIVHTIDLGEIAKERRQEPVLRTRRPELYRPLAR